jgi:S-adenosylmethionine hydrolase
MASSLITLSTDFGLAAPYVAAMKGVILTINPRVQIVDLTHSIPAQDVRHAAFFLAASLPYFPPDTVHVVVVDPGVGTERKLLFVEIGGLKILVPDNGCWTLLEGEGGQKPVVRSLSEQRFWRPSVSATFHGRDILAPVAAHLSLGEAASSFGPAVISWQRLKLPRAKAAEGGSIGEIVFVDDFGNLITNIVASQIGGTIRRLRVGRRVMRSGFAQVRTYGEAEAGSLVLLESSTGLLEVAVANGNAARDLSLQVGSPVAVHWN